METGRNKGEKIMSFECRLGRKENEQHFLPFLIKRYTGTMALVLSSNFASRLSSGSSGQDAMYQLMLLQPVIGALTKIDRRIKTAFDALHNLFRSHALAGSSSKKISVKALKEMLALRVSCCLCT